MTSLSQLAVKVEPLADPLDALVHQAKETLKTLLAAGTPICVSWSAGKDSSTVLSLVLDAARELRQAGGDPAPILVTHADTRIENPEVVAHAVAEMSKVRAYAAQHGLDVEVAVARPGLNETWAVGVIGGRRLPTYPNSSSRDCTVDFKIKPMRRLRKQMLREIEERCGETPVTVIGTRFDESESRARRMAERGETDTAVRTDPNGERFLSPICFWETDHVWEYLGKCRSGRYQSYSDFDDTFRIYADAAGTSCAVVGDMMTSTSKKSKGCGARHGCALCCAVGRDASLENMLETDERYAYLRGLNRLQRFLLATQYDLTRRNWLGRSINPQGYMAIAPDTFHPRMLADLLRYALTLDLDEKRAAAKQGLSAPRFELISLEALITIDAMWSLQGFHRPFEALAIYRDVYIEGHRYPVPEIESAPAVPIPSPRYYFVGSDWDEGHEWAFCGLTDPLLETFGGDGCMGMTTLRDGRQVLDLLTEDRLEVDEESALLVLDLELDYLLERFHAAERVSVTEAYRYYVRMGVISVASGQLGKIDEILRRTAFKERHGLVGPDVEHRTLLERTISAKEMRLLAGDPPAEPTPDPMLEISFQTEACTPEPRIGLTQMALF